MKPRRDVLLSNVLDLEGLSDNDAREAELMATYCRLVDAAKRAGVPHGEAAVSIYADVYERDDVL